MFQLHELLTADKYLIASEDLVVQRNSECEFGGDKMTVTIKNPEDEIITGVELLLTPYIPNQDLGQSKFFSQIKKEEVFTDDSQLIVNVPVNPEYSYLIAASYKTKYGKLRPSENVGELGEFEHMMDKVGCQIRNNIYFKDKTPSQVKEVSSSLKCAEECFGDNVKCTDAWSYQIATKICHFYNNLADSDIAKLQPNSQIQQTDRTIGWASGLKSCNANLGKIFKLFCLVLGHTLLSAKQTYKP